MNDEDREFFAKDITDQLRWFSRENTNAVATVARVEILKLRAALAASESANAELRAECERMRGRILSIIGQFLSVRKINTPEWLEAIECQINEHAEAIGERDRVFFNGDGFQIIKHEPTKGAP